LESAVFNRRETRYEVRDPEPDTGDRVLAGAEWSALFAILALLGVALAFPFTPVKFAVIGGFAFILLLQMMRRPAFGLAMVAMGTSALDLVPPSLFPVPGLNAETFVIILAVICWWRMTTVGGKDGFGSPLGRVLLLYAAAIVLSTVNAWLTWNVSLIEVLKEAKNHLSYIVFFPVAFHVARERRDQKLLVLAGALTILLHSLQAIQHSLPALVGGNLERYRAMALLAIQPNIFGGALALYLPTFFVLAFNRVGSRAMNLFFLVVTGATAFALLLTLSRGAWIGAAAGLFIVSLYRNWRLLIIVGIIASTATIWAPQQVKDRIFETGETQGDIGVADQIVDDSAQMRVEQYKSLPAMMAPRPILGHGYSSYPQVFERYGTLQRYKGAHSTYCQIGTEGGLIGLAILGLVFFTLIMVGIRGVKLIEDPFGRALALGVIGGALSMALCMGTGARFEPQKIFVFYWIVAGIAERQAIVARMRQTPSRSDLGTAPPRTDERLHGAT
jgi:O-antigen ligase